MKRNQRRVQTKVNKIFEKYICKLVIIIFLIIHAILICDSLRRTGYNAGGNGYFGEDVFFESDSLITNILLVILFVAVIGLIIFVLSKLFGNETNSNKKILWVVMGLSGIMSLIWVFSLREYPQADQYFICEAAVQMNHGDFSSLQKGGYAAIYQQQLGMITLLRLFFKVFGDMRWLPFQAFNALFVPVIIYGGYQITRIISKNSISAERIYLILSFSFVPMYIYTPYIYGEIMSTAFSILGIWMFLECCCHLTWYKLLALGVSMGIAVQLRENCIIVAVAMILSCILILIRGEWKESFLIALATVMGIGLFWGAIHHGIYAKYIGEEVEGMPATLHIAMGTNDDGVNAGYYNVYNYATFVESDYNAKVADQKAKQKLAEFITFCKENPRYAIDFYARKIEGQWNVPMLQCLPMNGKYNEEAICGVAKAMYFGKISDWSQDFMNIWQQVLYLSAAFLIWKKRKEWNKIEYFILPIIVIGGFLFSILWEAKARYIFIYIVLLIPLAANGLNNFLNVRKKDEME